MNALFQKIKDTFTQAQGKRVTTQGTYVTVVSVEHVRHNAGSARLVNRRWSDDMAHDELIVTFRSKNGTTQLILTAFDHDTDDVRYAHLQNNIVCFFGKIVDEDDIDVKGWSVEHVAITE
jgi:hypothetical protein